MKRNFIVFATAAAAALTFAAVAFAQSGHFIGTPTCSDTGLTLTCTGKVAGLGSTNTFRVTVTANGTASVTCSNPAGNVAPGQSFSFTASGTTGNQPVPNNGQATFTVSTTAPSAPAGSCPNPKWTATVTGVTFTGSATLSLFEGNSLSDTITVPIS